MAKMATDASPPPPPPAAAAALAVARRGNRADLPAAAALPFLYLPPEQQQQQQHGLVLPGDAIQCINTRLLPRQREKKMSHAKPWPSTELLRTSHNEELHVLINMFMGSAMPQLGGFYFEMGAFDGVQESNSNLFEKCLGWSGLLVEASPQTFSIMKDNRPRNHRANVAPSCHVTGSHAPADPPSACAKYACRTSRMGTSHPGQRTRPAARRAARSAKDATLTGSRVATPVPFRFTRFGNMFC